MMQSASIIKYTQASLELETQASQTLPDPKQQTHSPWVHSQMVEINELVVSVPSLISRNRYGPKKMMEK